MAFTTTNLGLDVWNLLTDTFDHSQLQNNWVKIDDHDHGANGGLQIQTAGIANQAVTAQKIANSTITDVQVAPANKDGFDYVPSMRTLGFGSQQAMPGNALPGGPPTGPARGDLGGTYPNPEVVTVDGGHVPITDVTTAGGSLTGTYPNPVIGQNVVTGGTHGMMALNTITGDNINTDAQITANGGVASQTGFYVGTNLNFSGLGLNCLAAPLSALWGELGNFKYDTHRLNDVSNPPPFITFHNGNSSASVQITHSCVDFNGNPVTPSSIQITPCYTSGAEKAWMNYDINLTLDLFLTPPTTTTFNVIGFIGPGGPSTVSGDLTIHFTWVALSF